MSILQSIVYGIISGFAEFLPISSQAHQTILKTLFGQDSIDPFRSLLIHIFLLLAILASCGTYIQRLRRDQRMNHKRTRGKQIDRRTAYEYRFLKSAAIPMLIGSVIYIFTKQLHDNLAVIALFFTINGIVIYAPEHLPHSNKDASGMSRLDSFLVGISGVLGIFPGISRIGATYSCAVARGADKEKALNWVLVLNIPALVLLCVFDIMDLVSFGFGVVTFQIVVGMVLSAIMAFFAACCGIFLLRFLTVRSGITAFGFYCWGAALLSLILYLTA